MNDKSPSAVHCPNCSTEIADEKTCITCGLAFRPIVRVEAIGDQRMVYAVAKRLREFDPSLQLQALTSQLPTKGLVLPLTTVWEASSLADALRSLGAEVHVDMASAGDSKGFLASFEYMTLPRAAILLCILGAVLYALLPISDPEPHLVQFAMSPTSHEQAWLEVEAPPPEPAPENLWAEETPAEPKQARPNNSFDPVTRLVRSFESRYAGGCRFVARRGFTVKVMTYKGGQPGHIGHQCEYAPELLWEGTLQEMEASELFGEEDSSRRISMYTYQTGDLYQIMNMGCERPVMLPPLHEFPPTKEELEPFQNSSVEY
jgi:hypothetical protein